MSFCGQVETAVSHSQVAPVATPLLPLQTVQPSHRAPQIQRPPPARPHADAILAAGRNGFLSNCSWESGLESDAVTSSHVPTSPSHRHPPHSLSPSSPLLASGGPNLKSFRLCASIVCVGSPRIRFSGPLDRRAASSRPPPGGFPVIFRAGSGEVRGVRSDGLLRGAVCWRSDLPSSGGVQCGGGSVTGDDNDDDDDPCGCSSLFFACRSGRTRHRLPSSLQ